MATSAFTFAQNLGDSAEFLMFVEDIKTAQKFGESCRVQETADWRAEAISEIIRETLSAYPGQWAET